MRSAAAFCKLILLALLILGHRFYYVLLMGNGHALARSAKLNWSTNVYTVTCSVEKSSQERMPR